MNVIKNDLSEYQKEIINKIYFENKSLRDTETEIKIELEKIMSDYERCGNVIKYESIPPAQGLKREFFQKVQVSGKSPAVIFDKMNNKVWYEHLKILKMIKGSLKDHKCN